MTNPKLETIRIASLLMAMGVYAVCGSPTPDSPGLIEGLIGLLLVCSIGISGVFQAVMIRPDRPLWFSAGQVFLLYGMMMGVLTALARGNAPSLMLRDMFPFLFLFLPVFLYPLFEKRPVFFCYVLYGVLTCGVLFAVRAVADQGVLVLSILSGASKGELTYLANAPTVLFAATFLIGAGLHRFLVTAHMRDGLFLLLAGVLAVMCIVPMVLTMQRASIGYVVLYSMVIGLIGFVKAPVRMAGVVFCVAILCLPVAWVFFDTVVILREKTEAVGLNMRTQELGAVWAELIRSPVSFLFGTGWGGTFESPAVGELRVNFTHGFLTSMLLKTGMVGAVLAVIYMTGIGLRLLSFIKENPALILALAGPIGIDVFLYASFKSLDFGLILLLACTYIPAVSNIASRR